MMTDDDHNASDDGRRDRPDEELARKLVEPARAESVDLVDRLGC